MLTQDVITLDPLAHVAKHRALSARLALEEANKSCPHSVGGAHSLGGRDCSWFHGAWQYLMLLGMSASPERNLPFYTQELRRAASNPDRRRLLISGCSDQTMLAIVLAAIAGLENTPAITVIDRCDTPLASCRWFAEQVDFPIATQKCDLVTYQPDNPFDIICTDGLLSNLEPNGRAAAVAAWHRLLNPGLGVLITTNNIRQVGMNAGTLPSPETIATLCDRAVERKAAAPYDIPLTDEALYDLAYNYFSRPKSIPIGTAAEFETFFRAAQFQIEALTCTEIGGEALAARHAATGQNIPKTLNARIVAARR